MKKILLVILTGVPALAFSMNIRVDIDINVINGDGTLAAGDKNNTNEERNQSGSETHEERNQNR
ncbi:MAG: hypothetical protein JSR80_00510 [Verrucomicrobia bacterium]|nr:hypothetical protein [Verrucomicrobiota bacterium]